VNTEFMYICRWRLKTYGKLTPPLTNLAVLRTLFYEHTHKVILQERCKTWRRHCPSMMWPMWRC